MRCVDHLFPHGSLTENTSSNHPSKPGRCSCLPFEGAPQQDPPAPQLLAVEKSGHLEQLTLQLILKAGELGVQNVIPLKTASDLLSAKL